jgi:hypothetical protein
MKFSHILGLSLRSEFDGVRALAIVALIVTVIVRVNIRLNKVGVIGKCLIEK